MTIDTTGNATIVVTYAGTAGVPVGSMPTETNSDGEFKVSILTTAADTGTFTLTAVYLKDGANTATAAKVTAAQAITVGSGDAVASDDTKVNAGSFKVMLLFTQRDTRVRNYPPRSETTGL